MITYKAVVDWGKLGYYHRDAIPGDAPNLFGTKAVKIGDLKRTVAGTVLDFSNDPLAKYGREGVLHTLGASGGSPITFGYDGSTYDITSPAGGTYTFVIWVDESNTPTPTFAVNGTPAIVTVDVWGKKQIKTTTTVAPGAGLAITITNTGAASASCMFSGAMIVEGDTAPAGYNSGLISTYDNLTPHLRSAEWQLGFDEPWQALAAAERGRLVLNNADRIFSPENSASVLYDYLITGRLLRIYADASSFVDQLMFTGLITRIAPSAGPNSTACTLEITGMRSFLNEAKLSLPVQLNKTAQQVAHAIINTVTFPDEINPNPGSEPAAGTWEVFPYLLDNIQNESEADALSALEDLAKAMQAKIWFDRQGLYNWKHLSEFGLNAWRTYDNSFVEAEYRYGETIINSSTVKYRKRKVGATNTETLYETTDTITLGAGESEKVRGYYKDPSQPNTKIGATEVSVVVTADAGVTHTFDADAQSCEVTLSNNTNESKNVTLVRVRGRKLTAYDEASWPVIDYASVAKYGLRSEIVDHSAISRRGFARKFAEWRVNNFSVARGEMLTITLKASSALLSDEIVNVGIGWIIRVVDHNTAHDGYYRIVGERHVADEGLAKVSATWVLERAYQQAVVSTTPPAYFGISNQLGRMQLLSEIF